MWLEERTKSNELLAACRLLLVLLFSASASHDHLQNANKWDPPASNGNVHLVSTATIGHM